MTEAKLNELKKELAHLKEIRPGAAAEVSRLAELGDFSENAEYQHAKGRLRGINNAMLRIEHQINNAEVIEKNDSAGEVQLGNVVTVEVDGKKKKFQILGSSETDPTQGIISRNSPIGEALLGREVGEEVEVKLPAKTVIYKILKIE